jgi:hypothetical protein
MVKGGEQVNRCYSHCENSLDGHCSLVLCCALNLTCFRLFQGSIWEGVFSKEGI